MRIRDPIHGTIPVQPQEKAVIDSPFYQRLRHIRQLGFGEMAFPGATHTRHAHGLGAMHVSSRLFDAVASHAGLPESISARFRAAVRLALLCHDLGHLPLSHASEAIAPPKKSLGLPEWLDRPSSRKSAQASHEDFTAKILLDSSLTPVLTEELARFELNPEALVALICGPTPPSGLSFTHAGVDWTPLLRAVVSGELDADRMDYLLRDSFYTGVNYGRYDLDWIVENLHPAQKEGAAYLALSKAAAFAFEDFLLSRYHMFVSVYYHHTSVSFDHMLRRYFEETKGEFEIPSDPEELIGCDDASLAVTLRRSKNRWAKRIVARRGYKLLTQFTERDAGYDLGKLGQGLAQAGIDHFSLESEGVLSKYFVQGSSGADCNLFILDASTGKLTEVERYTPLYRRYSGSVHLSRVYVLPEKIDQARRILSSLVSPLKANL